MRNGISKRMMVLGIGAGVLVLVGLLIWVLMIKAVKPDAGHEAVLIHKPVIFGHGGVDPTPIKTGRGYVWYTTEHIMVNMQPVQYTVHFEDLMSQDGVPLDFDSVLRVRVTDSVALIGNFGPKWYENNVQNEYMNRVRQSVRKHGMNETAIDTKAIEEIDAEVSKAMVEYIKEAKLPLALIQNTIGKANPPDSIKTQRIETAAQQQRILTEQQRKLAEDARKQAEKSRADADNAYREAMQFTPAQILQLENIKMLKEVGAKGGNTFIIGNGGATPVIDVSRQGKK